MTIVPSGPPNMPKLLVQWFIDCLVTGFFVAYLTGHTLPPGANYLAVLRVARTAALLACGLGNLSNGIWKGQIWTMTMTMKEVIDGLVCGLLTAGTFGWLSPRYTPGGAIHWKITPLLVAAVCRASARRKLLKANPVGYN
jgi:hypothetical protein